MKTKKIRVLIVDDSALIRRLLTEGFSHDPDIEIVGTAQNPYTARDLLVTKRPDVMTLDVEMPKMDGVTFLKKFMKILPTPTVVLSSLTQKGKKVTIAALEAGAVSVMAKPQLSIVDGLPVMMDEIIKEVKAAARAKLCFSGNIETTPVTTAPAHYALEETTDKVIAIGASTGGVEALARILPTFPATSPGIVIVEHMPAGFTAEFANRLDKLSTINVKEAEHGDVVLSGRAFVAPGGSRHMEVHRLGGEYIIRLTESDLVSGHRPSVDVLFSSIAKNVGKNACAAILTGMGADGAQGLLEIRKAGGRTFAQNEETCVIYGMPKKAIEFGAAEKSVSLEFIPEYLLRAIKRNSVVI